MKQDNTQKELALHSFMLYWRHVWKYKSKVIGLMIVVPLTIFVFNFLPPLILANILQRISTQDFVKGDLWASFGPSLLLYGGVSALGAIFLWRLSIYLIWSLENNVIRDIHQRIFTHLLSLSASFHTNRFGGSLVSQSNKFASAYIRIADSVTFDVFTLLLAFTFTAIILIPRAPMVVLALIAFSIIFIFVSIRSTKKVRELNSIEAEKSNKQTGFLADAITNVMAVKSFAGHDYERRRYNDATSATRTAANNVMRASLLRETVFASMTTSLGVGALVLSIASVVLFKADIGTVFLVISYTAVLGERLWEFSQRTLKNVNRAIGDARDMTEILQLQPSVRDPQTPQTAAIAQGSIDFKGVTFTHPENDEALFENLNITINPGEKIGLVGHSGSGKTSLTKLLLRFNDIDGGSIQIDGQDIASITQEDLRRNIAYVPQEPLLFHRSIRENIAYGKPEASDEQIKQAAAKANASDFIERLADGYDTLVGERGVKLSGGQRQRIVIARAILKDALILVLDEATSALDSDSEQLIQAALWQLMQGRTAIVIAHRLSTIQKMDRILVMEEGVIVEQGSHADLVKKGGVYAKLWAHQSGGFIEE